MRIAEQLWFGFGWVLSFALALIVCLSEGV